uniref:Uncharacterized protein n=1 Tax=Anguilla anguilla TaxID=7936 RepID=A0A0E9WJA0_ANGAN
MIWMGGTALASELVDFFIFIGACSRRCEQVLQLANLWRPISLASFLWDAGYRKPQTGSWNAFLSVHVQGAAGYV